LRHHFYLHSFPTRRSSDLACNILDIVTGFIKAYDQKDISSKKMKHGALAKVTIWCVVAVSIILSGYLDTDLTSYIVGYYLVMEMISILENVDRKSTRLNSSHVSISYAVFCLK